MEGDNRIRDRVFGKGLAGEVIGLASENFPGASKEMQSGFWNAIAEQAKAALEKLGEKPEQKPALPVPMTAAEVKRFEKSRIPFGKFTDHTVESVMEKNASYLDWLCRESEADVFKASLIRYLANEDVQKGMPDGNED